MEIYTIGFTHRGARNFFEALKGAGVRRLIDIRLRNTSQLAGFAKREDLAYFLEQFGMDYRHERSLAPTEPMLNAYKKKAISWDEFAAQFRGLLEEREVEKTLDKTLFDEPAVLLCSEREAEHCHRRLAAEYLAEHWDNARITHL